MKEKPIRPLQEIKLLMHWIAFLIFFLQLLIPFLFAFFEADYKYYSWSSVLPVGWMQFFLLSVIVRYAVDSIENL